MEKPKALILGCSGQDGSLISKLLLEKGYKVIGTSRNSNKEIESHKRLGISNQIKIITNNLLKINEIEEIINSEEPNEIYNFAAQSSVGLSFKYPEKTIESIVDITHNILIACKKNKFNGRLFFAGSSEMFGNTAEPAKESSLKNPLSPYADAKLRSFLLVKKFREELNMKCVTGIFFNHESNLRPKNFVTQKIVTKAKKIAEGSNEKLRLGNINIIRDWGSAQEYMIAAQKVIKNDKLKDYTICTGKSISLRYFVDNVFKQLGLRWEDHVEIDKTLFRTNEIDKSIGDPHEIYKDLGWKAQKDIHDVIRELIDD